ncbi:hypothetical protein D7024_09445 [Desulfofundulus salinus]|uniref:Uncharacterized protein n=1 Tax=Desulfofundulus salinus TaxID=2419843 RepID=A0A494WXW1_9FIRM|nr:hypothetical protein D7024_09445 [Desulfofundulus salinum]
MRLHNRQIKASFWNDPDLLQWPREKRWFYLGLVQLADDSGCLENSPFAFKIQLFPSPLDADITVELLTQWRDELIQAGKLIPYDVGGKPYLYIANFHKHQTPDKPTPPSKASIPLPPWLEWVEGESRRTSRYVVREELLPVSLTDDHCPGYVRDVSGTSPGQVRVELEPELELNNTFLTERANAPDGAAVPDGTRQGDSLPLPNEGESQEEITQEGDSDEKTPVIPITSTVESIVIPAENGGIDEKVTPLKLKRAKNKADPRVRHVLRYFQDTAVKHMGLTPVIDYGKHGKLIKQRLAALDHDHEDPDESLSEMCRLIDAFFETDDPFVSRAGRTISVFLAANVFEKLRQTLARAQPPVSQRTYERPEFLDWEIGGA